MLKWVGTVVYVLITALTGLSVLLEVIWGPTSSVFGVVLSKGSVYIGYDWGGWYQWVPEGFEVAWASSDRFPFIWEQDWWPLAVPLSSSCSFLIIPLWIPALLTAVPTAFFWWIDRHRFAAGHCQECGYNLTGNVSGRCPECGKLIIEAGVVSPRQSSRPRFWIGIGIGIALVLAMLPLVFSSLVSVMFNRWLTAVENKVAAEDAKARAATEAAEARAVTKFLEQMLQSQSTTAPATAHDESEP